VIVPLVTLAQATEEAVGLTAAGTAIMAVSVLLVLGLNVFCMFRILVERRPAESLHAPQETNTGDTDT